MQIAGFILLGYLSGSVLYARVFARLFGKEEMIENSRDRNPGTANAFMYGGFWCGLLTLICDIHARGGAVASWCDRHITGAGSTGGRTCISCVLQVERRQRDRRDIRIAAWIVSGIEAGGYTGGVFHFFLCCPACQPALLPHADGISLRVVLHGLQH